MRLSSLTAGLVGHFERRFSMEPSMRDARRELGRSRNEFRGNDFADMEFWDVGFRTGIDLTQQLLPSGPEYVYVPSAKSALQRARQAIEGWETPDIRERALVFIQTLELEASEGQRQLLLRFDDFPGTERDVVERVLRLLGDK